MATKKIDGIIEAVRYCPDGRIDMVRAYERRGAVWSDCILLDRKDLVERLARGIRFLTGERKTYLGSAFDTGMPIRKVNDDIVTGEQSGKRDLLAGVPVF